MVSFTANSKRKTGKLTVPSTEIVNLDLALLSQRATFRTVGVVPTADVWAHGLDSAVEVAREEQEGDHFWGGDDGRHGLGA